MRRGDRAPFPPNPARWELEREQGDDEGHEEGWAKEGWAEEGEGSSGSEIDARAHHEAVSASAKEDCGEGSGAVVVVVRFGVARPTKPAAVAAVAVARATHLAGRAGTTQ